MLRVAKSLIIRPGSVTSCVLLLLIGLTTNQLARPILLSANILSTSARRMVRAARSQIFGDANVTPTSGSLTVVVNTTGNHAVFEVDNTDANPENYSLSCVVSSPVTSCDSPPSVFVDGNSSAVVDVLFATGGTGIGGVTLFVGGLGGSSPGHYDVTVQQARIAPTIANMSGGDVRDVSRCVNNCFENVKSYTTPSYVSLDVPRSTTLLYRSGSAHPTTRRRPQTRMSYSCSARTGRMSTS